MKKYKEAVDFIFEARILKNMPRTGWFNLDGVSESIAEHSYYTTLIGLVLASFCKTDVNKVIFMLLLHDLPEVRTGDINKLYKFYITKNEEKAIKDQKRNLPFAGKYEKLMDEYNKCKTKEAKIAHDADVLSIIVKVKELLDNGNNQVKDWFDADLKRLHTKEARLFAQTLAKTNSQDWWSEIRSKISDEYKKR